MVMTDQDPVTNHDMNQHEMDFLDKYGLVDLLKRFGEPQIYDGYKRDTKTVTLAATIVGKNDFSIILALQQELNKLGFNNFRSFDNSQPGWPLYTPHIVCDAYALEAIVGYYDQFVKPEDRGELDITVCEESEVSKITGADRVLSHPVNYKDVDSDDYLQVADDFREKAKDFLDKHKVIELLNNYGQSEVYGSLALGLMNRSDIDTVLVVDKKDFSIAIDLQRKLQSQGFTNFWVFDNSRG